jgi:integrase
VLTADQARGAAKAALAKVALGEDPQAVKVARRKADTHTFRALVDEHLAAKQSEVRPRTFTELQRYLTGSTYFKPLHSMPIDQVTRKDVAALLNVIKRECGLVTAIRARSHLSSFFAWAIAQGLTETNPTIGAAQLEQPDARDRVLTDAELVAVWNAGDDDFGRIVRLLILTGQRRTEVGGMRWPELDLDKATWTIPEERAKNGREHKVPLSALALSIINAVPRMVGRDCLFGERSSGGFTLWAFAKAALDKRLGDRVKPWVLHDLRRTFCTRLADLGVLPHVIEAAVNHQSGHKAGVAGTYNRSPYEREVRAAMALWADHVRTLVEGGERKIVSMPQRAS